MARNWTYGDSWGKYPIEAGQIWRHPPSDSAVCVHDLRQPLPSFLRGAAMIYTDPPWSQGNVNSFITKAGLTSYVESFTDFLDALFLRVAEIGPQVCYLEAGQQHVAEVESRLGRLFASVQRWGITYYRKHACCLLRGGASPTGVHFTGLDDGQTPEVAIRAERPANVADICLGRGLTLLAAHQHNVRVLGTELNKRRLAVALDRAARMGVIYQCTTPH